ncbi:MAG: glycosyltransferase family 4 protein, partial [Bacteroidales bacterium]
LIYVLQYQNKLSPSFLCVATGMNIPVVQRISDYGHICANQLFYNFKLKSVCEKCLVGSKINAIRYSCVYNSAIYSFIKVLAQKLHDIIGIKDKIDAFVVPSKFTISKFIESGFSGSKLKHIPSFYLNHETISLKDINFGDYALYIGRVEEEKGVMTLVKAFEGSEMPLKIAGISSNGFDKKVRDYLKDKVHRIEFLGGQSTENVRQLLYNCTFTVCPSECYDNFPNSVIESFAFMKPVISSNIGSLTELVGHEQTGLLFDPGDHEALRACCGRLFTNREELEKMGKAARARLDEEFSEDKHYNLLISLFSSLTGQSPEHNLS